MSVVKKDTELIIRCLNKDGDAWIELVKKYERFIFSIARKQGLPKDLAEDVTQIVLLAMFDSLEKIDPNKLAAWLAMVTKRQSWRVRETYRNTSLFSEVPEESIDDSSQETAELLDLRKALAGLDNDSQMLIYHRFFDPEAPDYKETAELLGKAVGSIGPALGRVFEKLRKEMAS